MSNHTIVPRRLAATEAISTSGTQPTAGPRRERYLRTSEVASKLQVSPKTVSRWAKEGRLPYLATLGGHRRFPASAIDQLLGSLSSITTFLDSLPDRAPENQNHH